MVLQVDGHGLWALGFSCAGLVFDLLLVMDGETIMVDRDDGVLGFLVVFVPASCLEMNVVRLPGQWWQAHIDRW